ncbi:unnamed protein product [Brassica rapa]|uniref:Uncharacterized protein n=3 Tax=Brassica TaxID=3705 RepID=A0A3P5YUB4_BRACM|nr:unnamed protein product [Brassica napus]CAG7875741.1 unnamed protein product [Brassica rapa]CDY23671.1 BnaA05g17580D [Brassica napus]VDC71317.1 unnamed protein product [Brassica rapa]
MQDTEASHHKLSDGSSSINLNITSSPIEGDNCSGRGLSKEVKAVEDLVFFFSLRAPRPFFSIKDPLSCDVRGSPFSHKKIGQYFYLVTTGCGFALSILSNLMGYYLMVSLCSSNTLRSKGGELSNHNLLAMPVILEQKDNVDALVQKNRSELRKTRTGSTDLHRQGIISAITGGLSGVV